MKYRRFCHVDGRACALPFITVYIKRVELSLAAKYDTVDNSEERRKQ